jgi:nitronate monooxygenase
MTLQSLLGIELPIIQAPMATIGDSALAVAVSNAGGLGSLAAALLGPDALRNELAEIRARTIKPFNVNFYCHAPASLTADRAGAWRAKLAPYYAELGLDANAVPEGGMPPPFGSAIADLVEEFRPPVVSFHFGLPADELLGRVRAWGSKILSSATTIDEARWLEARGVDAIIAQGFEAGGHRGMFLSEDPDSQIGTLALVRQIVKAVRTPVIAAGGIADAKGLAAAMTLGAAGVQVGTAYLLCTEAMTSPVHRAALKSEAARRTALTNVLTGRLARAIVNRVVGEVGPISAAAPSFPLAIVALAPLRAKAESRGSNDFSSLWAGQNTSGCKEVPAAQLTRELVAGV